MQSSYIKSFIILLLVAMIGLPVFTIFDSWFVAKIDIFEYFSVDFLINLISSSFILLLGVSFFTAIIGTTLAFLVVFVDFPFKNFFKTALFLPFAIPAYVLGFIYLGIFDYSGYGQTFMRDHFGIQGFDLRSSNLAIILTFSLAFYPYVYMLAKASFIRQNSNILQSARLLGASPIKIFLMVAIPLIRPAIAAGVLVTIMETLADFGLVSMFNYNTFTLAIYSAWSDFRSIEAASQLSSILMIFAILFIFLEKKARGSAKYYSYGNINTTLYKVTGLKKYLITVFPLLILLIAFILPIVQLIIWSINIDFAISNYILVIKNSFILIVISVTSIIAISLILNLVKQNKILQNISSIVTIGYAIPGSIIAVSLLYSVSFIQSNTLSYLLSNSIILLIFAYIIRFIAISYNTILSSKKQIKPVFIQSALMLGVSKFKLIINVYLPMLKSGILAASILVAIDILKELPATYLLRPFSFDTLAIKVYEFSSEGMYETAAIPALIMVIIAIILILIMNNIDKK